MNVPKDLQNYINKGIKLAAELRNSELEPEHVLKYILAGKKSVLSTILSAEESTKLESDLQTTIDNFPVITQKAAPTPGRTLQYIFAVTEKITTDEFVKECCKFDRIKKLLPVNIEERLKTVKPSKQCDFAIDMVQQAREGRYDPVIGREEEIRSVIEVLAKKTKSNVILVGLPGVGKTAVVNAIAQMIANDNAPGLKGARILNVDLGGMIAGAGVRGEFEERLKSVITEAEKCPEVILFIDEIHTVLRAGTCGDGSLDAANILKPALADGRIKCIGATTFDEYRKYVENDAAFARRFVSVTIKEPSVEDAITMLRGLRERFETHHGTRISDNALVFAATMAKKCIPNRRLPDIALDLVDTACASRIVSLESEPPEISIVRQKLWSAELEKASIELDLERSKGQQGNENKVRIEDTNNRYGDVVAKIASLKNELMPLEAEYKRENEMLIESRRLKKKLEDIRYKIARAEVDRDIGKVIDLKENVIPEIEARIAQIGALETINSENIAEVISKWTGIPVNRLTMKDNERLLKMSYRIKERLFGQEEAVNAVAESILRSRVGLTPKNRPIGVFLFLGPTGVGKTELAKALGYELFDDDRNFVFLDMSDYCNEASVTKLIGAPAGYVGYGEGGALTEPVRNKPYNIVLLDEIDLANQKVLNVLYQYMDEGRVTDGKRNEVDFRNTVLIMTSNLGQEILVKEVLTEDDSKELEKMVVRKFGPAFYNRIDSVVYFHPLTSESLFKILKLQLDELNGVLSAKNVHFKLSDYAIKIAIERGFSPFYGARPLKRYFYKTFANAITGILLKTSKRDDTKLVIWCFHESEGISGDLIGEYVYFTNCID